VIASRGPDGSPQAALVGIAATDRGEIVFDCSRRSRKYANIERDPAVALVIGWDDEVTVQVEGSAQVLSGTDLERPHSSDCCTPTSSQSDSARTATGPKSTLSSTTSPRAASTAKPFSTPTSQPHRSPPIRNR